MPHTYECPMRWSDMDLLGHVNNVTYLDYVTEARADLLAGHPAATAGVRRHQVEFAAPLVFRRAPVLVDTWVSHLGEDEITLEHTVYDEAQDGREGTVYLHAVTVLDHAADDQERELLAGLLGEAHPWRTLSEQPRPAGAPYGLQVRRADLDERGQVSEARFFELFQESRIRFLMDVHHHGQHWSHHVVARTDVEYLAPVPHRRTAYDVQTWLGHLGRRSFTLQAELRDGETVLARTSSVMVAFDAKTQRPGEMTQVQRERLAEVLAGQRAARPA